MLAYQCVSKTNFLENYSIVTKPAMKLRKRTGKLSEAIHQLMWIEHDFRQSQSGLKYTTFYENSKKVNSELEKEYCQAQRKLTIPHHTTKSCVSPYSI